jgi:hypothetical protein
VRLQTVEHGKKAVKNTSWCSNTLFHLSAQLHINVENLEHVQTGNTTHTHNSPSQLLNFKQYAYMTRFIVPNRMLVHLRVHVANLSPPAFNCCTHGNIHKLYVASNEPNIGQHLWPHQHRGCTTNNTQLRHLTTVPPIPTASAFADLSE